MAKRKPARVATKTLKELAAKQVSKMLEGVPTETKMMLTCWEESEVGQGLCKMEDARVKH